MKKIGILIFARSSSKRYPGKVTQILYRKKTLLEIIYNRISKKSKNIPIIVNTSSNKSDDKIALLCKKKNIKFYRGSLKNLIKRTLQCCKKYKLKSFVRVNADRPFFDVKVMNKMIKVYLSNDYDIITNQFPRSSPKGLACEVANTKIFYKIKNLKLLKSEYEHIFNFFYKRNKYYKIKNFTDKFYKNKKHLNMSIDTKKQFKKTKVVYDKINSSSYIDTKFVIKKYERFFK